MEKFGDFKAKAGNDYTKIIDFINDLDIPNYNSNNFKFFAMELFYLLDFHFIFNKLTKIHYGSLEDSSTKPYILDDFEKKHNGSTINDLIEIEELRNKIRQKLTENQTFKIKLELLVNKYYNSLLTNNI